MELNWDILMSRSKAYGCEKALINQLWLCKYIFNAQLPAKITKSLTDLGDSLLVKNLIIHLDDKTEYKPSTIAHLEYLKRIKNPMQRLLYVLEVLFPTKRLLVNAYKIKNHKLFWMWYPYRWWIGLKGLFIRRK